MITKQLILAGCVAMLLAVGTAQAGPCNTTGTSANSRDAGSGSGDTGQAAGARRSAANERAPTGTMNRATEAQPGQEAEPSAKMTDKDQPTPPRQTQSPEPSEKMADQGC
jgi:hypothetical protein